MENNHKFTVTLVKHILGTKVIGLRFPHQKTIRDVEKINKFFPVTENGITNVDMGENNKVKIKVFDDGTSKEEWTFFLKVRRGKCRVVKYISPEGDAFSIDDPVTLFANVPSDVLRFGMYGHKVLYDDVLKEHDDIVDGNKVTTPVDVRWCVYS